MSKSTNVTHVCARSYCFRDITFLNLLSSKSRLRQELTHVHTYTHTDKEMDKPMDIGEILQINLIIYLSSLLNDVNFRKRIFNSNYV